MTVEPPNILMRWELWNTAIIAERSGYKRRYVDEHLTKRPDFPAPIRVDGGKPRWVAAEVIAYFEAHRADAHALRQAGGNTSAMN